jgi:hypothetical protein
LNQVIWINLDAGFSFIHEDTVFKEVLEQEISQRYVSDSIFVPISRVTPKKADKLIQKISRLNTQQFPENKF